MWYGGLFEFIYTTLFVHQGTLSELPTGKLSSEIRTNGTSEIGYYNLRPCPIGDPIQLYYNHSNPNLRGCFKKFGSRPCGRNMRFYDAGEDNIYGECDCDHSSARTLVYDDKTGNCFPIFQQGYCNSGMWIDVNQSGHPFCQLNPCYSSDSPDAEKDIVFFNDTCVKVGSACGVDGGTVQFQEGRRLPGCVTRKTLLAGMGMRAIGVPRVRCKPGTYRALSGRCQPKLDIYY